MDTDAIFSDDEVMKLSEETRWQAVVERDASLDGTFVFAVSSTGIFCRPSCPAKAPRRENVRFFDHAAAAEHAGYRACLRCRPKAVDGNPQSALVRAICRYIEQHIEDRLTLGLLGKEFRLSPFHLQRTFKAVLGVSPKAYIDACRLRQVKQNLQAGHNVTTSLYAAGYGSSSRLYERTAAQLGMTPEKYRRGALAAIVRYTTASSPLGRMLIAATDKGICAIQFADSDAELQQGLMREFPFAVRKRDDEAMAQWKQSLGRLIEGEETNPVVAPRHSRHRLPAESLGTLADGSPAEKLAPTAKSPARSACRKRPAPWLAPALPTRWPSRFPAIA